MEHQDYSNVVFGEKNKIENLKEKKVIETRISRYETNKDEIKIVPNKKLGQLLSQARLTKGFNKQVDFVNEFNSKSSLKMSLQLYTKWEANKEIPTNEQISKIEKVLCVKLPRNIKIKINS